MGKSVKVDFVMRVTDVPTLKRRKGGCEHEVTFNMNMAVLLCHCAIFNSQNQPLIFETIH